MSRHLAGMASVEETHWWFRTRRELVAQVVEAHVPAGSDIVDVGCGTGFILERMRGRYRTCGFDPEPVAIDRCRARGLDEVHLGALGAVDLGRREFALAMVLDVLEHVDDDVAALAEARALIRDDGLLLVVVPAHPLLFGGHDVAWEHRRRYTRRTLERALGAAGCEPLHVTHFNTLLFPLVAAARLLGKAMHAPARSDVGLLPPPFNRALEAVFSLERALLPRMALPFGVSLLCLARKRC